MKKYNIAYALILTIVLAGCSNNNAVEETHEIHNDTFVKVETDKNLYTENSTENENNDVADINIISDYTPEEIDNANIFKEPNINLGDYYNEVNNDTINENNVDNNGIQITNSDNVNNLINKLMIDENFTEVKLIDEWNDSAIKAYTYRVVFDESKMYTILEDSDGNVYETENDYQYYLDNL